MELFLLIIQNRLPIGPKRMLKMAITVKTFNSFTPPSYEFSKETKNI